MPAPEIAPGCVLVSLERWAGALVLRLGAPAGRMDDPPDIGPDIWRWTLRFGDTTVEAGHFVCGLRTDTLIVEARFSTVAPVMEGRPCVLTVGAGPGTTVTAPFTVPGGPATEG